MAFWSFDSNCFAYAWELASSLARASVVSGDGVDGQILTLVIRWSSWSVLKIVNRNKDWVTDRGIRCHSLLD